MQIRTIEVGGFGVNCSILSEGGTAWIIDPGQEAERIVSLLAQDHLEPAAILLTHAHFDHIGGVPSLLKAFPELPIHIHPNDAKVISHPQNQFPPEYPPIGQIANLTGFESLSLPSDFEIIETPGHTPGGVCYYFPHPSPENPQPLLFSGDTLFSGSVGRTDLPGGDWATLMASLTKLTALPDETRVIPGHGSSTTIGAEKRTNPYLRNL